jgi:adenine phosphoribosyltransferase
MSAGRPVSEVPGLAAALRAAIVEVPDFPRPGIGFKDITPVLADAALFRRTVEGLAAPWRDRAITHVLAIESRGFLFGGPVAVALGAALVPLRKPGKLPRSYVSEGYALEYGEDALQMHRDALPRGGRALIVDDVLATGGTCAAALRLVEALNATAAGVSIVIDLGFLPWRKALTGREVHTLVSY